MLAITVPQASAAVAAAAPSNTRRCMISTESMGAAGSKAAARGWPDMPSA
jgi:hypothetical protein